MKFMYHIGVDISKKTLDICILDDKGNVLLRSVVNNNPKDISEWIETLGKEVLDWGKTLVCMEHSGYYGARLLNLLHEKTDCTIWLENAVQIKRSMGILRGKDDRTDALRISLYSIDFQRKIRVWEPSEPNIEKLKLLISHRDRMVKSRVSIALGLEEQDGFVDKDVHRELDDMTSPLLKEMDRTIKLLERKINELISSDEELSRQSKVIQSIPGFGPVISSKVIGVTAGFSRLDNPRKLACYAGVAPFNHSSGTSVKRKARVSHIANKDIKKMFHLAAITTIRENGIMHKFYLRKLAEGKNKMAVINAVRNKLIHILVACVKNDTMYMENYQHKLA